METQTGASKITSLNCDTMEMKGGRSMKKLKIVLLVELILLISMALFAAAGLNPLARRSSLDFEKGIEGWRVLDRNIAALSLEPDLASIHDGKGSLRCDYHYEEGKINAFGATKMGLAGKKGVRFWAKSNAPALLAVVIKEKGKGHYIYPVALGEAGKWKEGYFNFSAMTEGENSHDENGHLDLEGASLGFIDLLPLFSGDSGKRTLWIDSISLLDEEIAGPGEPGAYHCTFDNDTEKWVAVNNNHSSIKICRESENVKEGRGSLEFDYTITPEAIIALGAMGIRLNRCSAISFWVKTEEPSEIIIVLEKKNKARYKYEFETAAKAWKHISAPLSHFALAEDSSDDDGQLDREHLKDLVVLADSDNFTYFKEGDQKLWIDDFRILENEEARE
jgi:hypothetical protein